MELGSQTLTFPTNFCCNCGDTNCANEIQDTRVSRYFRIGGTGTSFQLPVPVCARCVRSTRRRPRGFFFQLSLIAASIGVALLALWALSSSYTLPVWIVDHRFALSVVLALLVNFGIWRLRRPKPPMTSFYQPVRVKRADVQLTDLMSGTGHVGYLKLGFTNPDYLNLFVNANQDAIKAGRLAAVKS
jgi:hypothetical protein